MKEVSLETLGGGVAVELFNEELANVLENILDENTKPDAVREVTLKLKIKPDRNRDMTNVEVHATSKLAPVMPHPAVFFMGKKSGKAVAFETDPKQPGLWESDQRSANEKVAKLPERSAQ